MLLKLINNAVQKYLNSDPEIAAKLNQYEGKKLLVHLNDLDKKFIVTPELSSITVSEHVAAEDQDESPQKFTTTIHSNIISLVRMGLGAEYQTMLNNGSLRIEGDVEFANQLRSIFKEVDIDWEEVASKYVGDSVAYQLGMFAKRFRGYGKRSLDNFQMDVSEYLQEESRILPTEVEINRFMSDVDDLDAYVQRLEARIQRLENQSNS